MDRRLLLVVTSLCFALSGCQHAHLRRVTTNQASTLTDMHYQQVLDNLAQIACHPHAMPYFAIPKEGVAQVDTTGEAAIGAEWSPTVRNLGFTGSRATSGNWGLEPVNESDKLIRMRCAYQLAVGCYTPTPDCQSCDEVFREFYGDKSGCRIPSTGWFGCGSKSDVPSEACYTGSCGKTYVWVCDDGLYELSRLTSVILDFALRSPEPDPQVKVTWEFKENKLSIKEIESLSASDAIVPPTLSTSRTTDQVTDPSIVPVPPTPSRSPGTIKDKGFPNYLQRSIPIRRR